MKIMNLFISVVFVVECTSCYDPFSNKRNTVMYDLNTNCVNDSAWSDLRKNLKKKSDTDKLPNGYRQAMIYIDKNHVFETSIYLLKDSPIVLIGIGPNSGDIRYIYDPRVVDQVVIAFDDSIYPLKYRLEIGERAQKFLMNYQCEEGRMKSIQAIKDERKYRTKRGW